MSGGETGLEKLGKSLVGNVGKRAVLIGNWGGKDNWQWPVSDGKDVHKRRNDINDSLANGRDLEVLTVVETLNVCQCRKEWGGKRGY